jgi:hypothetical protein
VPRGQRHHSNIRARGAFLAAAADAMTASNRAYDRSTILTALSNL